MCDPYNYPPTSRPAYVDGHTDRLLPIVDGHTDRLLPIVYGRPAPQAIRQAHQGKVVLRGCLVAGCDPHYYCPVHKKDR